MGADGKTSLLASISPINTIDLGPVEGVFQNMLVLDEDFFELEAVIGVPVYGIIGYEFFKNNPIRINYDDGLMDFYKREAVRWRPPFYHKLDMSIEDEKPYIFAKIQQKNGSVLIPKLLIDTGANHGVLLNRETSEEIILPPLTIETELGQSLGGVLYGFIGRLSSIKVAGLKMTEVLTSYPEENAYSYIFKESGRQGSLGSEVLGRTRLIIDYPRNRLLVKKGEDFYQPFQFDMSGIVVKKIPNDENRMYVSMVRKNSPAEGSGVLPFDEILSINKIPTFIWEMPEVVKLLRSEEGKEIEIEIRRYEGMDLTKYEDLRFKFVLKKQI
jgi:predicted aspartyl protease